MSITLGLIDTADLLALTDALCRAYRRDAGSVASGFGRGESGGTFGVADALADMVSTLYTSEYPDAINAIGDSLLALQTVLGAKNAFGRDARSFLLGLNNHATAFPPNPSVTSLDTLLSYLNVGAGGPWGALQDFWFYDIFMAAIGVPPSPHNLRRS